MLRRASSAVPVTPAAASTPTAILPWWTLTMPNAGTHWLRAALLMWRAALRSRLTRRPWRTLLDRTLLLPRLLRPLPFPRLPFSALSAWRNCRERNAAAGLVDIDHPHLQHVAHADDLVRIANKTVRQPADMNQAAVRQTNIDKHTKIDDVQHCARKLHPRRQILQLHDPAPEDGRRQVVTGIERRARQGGENVLQQVRSHAQFRGKLMHIDISRPFGDLTARRRRRFRQRGQRGDGLWLSRR